MSAMQKFNKRYRLRDGSIYWHKLYFDVVPEWMTKYSPPGGHYSYAAYLYQPQHYIYDLWLAAKWFMLRGRRGYSDCDVWNWCHYMAKVNSSALCQLAELKNGHPMGMTMAGWRKRLLAMADGFQALVDDDNDFKSYKLPRKEYLAVLRARSRRLDRGLSLYRDHFRDIWD